MNTHNILGLALVSMSLALGACDRRSDRDWNRRTGTTAHPTPKGTEADNTARNTVDRDSSTKTPMDQSNSSADIKITADIRSAIMGDKSMSMNAQNCKIITDKSGVVTLRGPVASQAEKDAIEAKVKAIAGVTRVVNDLEVKQN